MKHLILCREYPPAPSGGIGVYACQFSRLLAQRGETVHVIGQLWEKSADRVQTECGGRLIIHRVPYENGASLFPRQPHPALNQHCDKGLFTSEYPPQCFSWRASLLAERLVEDEGIDLIEAQEYEAPLYYFQLRRALGLGPKRQPPCIVHLHSPSELIARHNDWELGLPAVVTATRLENYSISAADSVLCPSRYLAQQAETHYGLDAGAVQVIPYPMGESRVVPRAGNIWEGGTICFVGRLEPRKGIFEWIDAAIGVAGEFPKVQFVFVGSDTIHHGASVRAGMERRIPAALKSAFRFIGERPRGSLPRYLAGARMAVVPSRWENFPYSCIEAMASGLPVIASREGGMAEMIEDGRTGWLSKSQRPEALAEALRRALETTPPRLAEMGNDAASRINRMCDNDTIVDARLAFHRQLTVQGATRSVRLPLSLSRGSSTARDKPRRRVPRADSQAGMAFVIHCSGGSAAVDECLRSLAAQTQKPVSVVMAIQAAPDGMGVPATTGAWPREVQVLRGPYADAVAAKNAGVEATVENGSNPLGIAILSAHDRIGPTFVAACESILKACPEVGLISCWSSDLQDGKKFSIKPCPSFPYQWLSNDAARFSAVRTEALGEAGNFRPVMKAGFDHWDLCNAVLANGWIAVTVPELLARHQFYDTDCPHLPNCDATMRAELLARFPDLIARDAGDILGLAFSSATGMLQTGASAWGERLSRARAMIRYPRSTARQICGRLRNKFLKHVRD